MAVDRVVTLSVPTKDGCGEFSITIAGITLRAWLPDDETARLVMHKMAETYRRGRQLERAISDAK